MGRLVHYRVRRLQHRAREASARSRAELSIASGFLALALALALLLGGGAPSARAAALKAIWGPSTHNGVSLFPLYHQLGDRIYEDDLHWDLIARTRPANPRDPNDPAYTWPAEVASAVAGAKRYKMSVALQIIGSPRWANGGKPPKWAPHRPGDYADFAIAAARRYRSVHLWMVWGEPSRSHNFRPLTPAHGVGPLNAKQQIAPHLYSRILDAAYGALKRVSSANLVIGGMTDTVASISPSAWIENMRLPDGRPPRLDMYGHNPFTLRDPNLANPQLSGGQLDFSDLGRLQELVNRNLGGPANPAPRLFLSEWTIPTGIDTEFNFHVDRALQAKWIADGLRIANQLPGVYALGWIHLYDEPPTSAGGLIEAGGTKKPGFFAWQRG
jgi:hypothetical protein